MRPSASWAASPLCRMSAVRTAGLASVSSSARLNAGLSKRPVDERVSLLARERRRERGLQVGPAKRLARDPLDHVVVDERARHGLGERAGEQPVDEVLDLGRRERSDRGVLELAASLGARARPQPGPTG